MVNVTIKSRKDTLSNWQTSNPVLSDGEVAVVEIPATDSTPAICLIKIGDGKTNFNTLQYMQSPAADVSAWAKASTKPEYDYSEIKNLTTMIVAGDNITATTNDNKVTIATTQNVAKIPGTLPDIGDIEALPVWNSDEGWKRIDADALKATANTIVKRNASGQIVTAAPTANGHATTKKYVDDKIGSPTCPDGMLSLQAGKTVTGTSSGGGAVALTTSVAGKRVAITYSDGLSSLGDISEISTSIGTITLTSGQSFTIPATAFRTGGKSPWRDEYYGLEVYAIKGSTTYKGDFVIEEAQDAGGVGHYSAKKLTEAGTYTLYIRAAALAADGNYAAPFHSSTIDLTGTFGLYGFVTASGDGISMQLDENNEHNIISLDDRIARVPSLTNSSIPVYANGKWQSCKMSDTKENYAIVRRTYLGRVKAADPGANDDLTTKKYVDELAASKQDTLTAGDGIDITDNTIKVDNTVARVDSSVLADLVMPIYTGSKSKWETVKAVYDNYTSYTLARRNKSGQVVVATPTADNQAANKYYVDTKATAGNIGWNKVVSSTSGSVTPIGMAMSDFHSANRLAFGKVAGITIESSTDGGATWVDSAIPDSEKIKLVSGCDGYHPHVGLVYPTTYVTAGRNATANDMLRITLDGYTMGVYTSARKLLIYVTTTGAAGCKVLVEGAKNADLTTFTELANQSISGWSGWNDITFSSGSKNFPFGGTSSVNYRIIRLTFSITSVDTSGGYPGFLQILNLALFGDTYWSTPSNYAKSGHLYSWDYGQNVTFPKQVRTSSVPTAENDLTNKKYVDGLINDNKIARLTDTSKQFVVPCWRGAEWTQYPLTEASITSYSIVQRTSLGQVRVGTPTEDNMATPKSYVDGKIAAISTGGGSSKKLLRFDGNTTAYFDHVATSAYQYTFHLRGVSAMATGSVTISVGGNILFSLAADSDGIEVDGTLMCYPARSSSSNTQHYITYSYTASDGTCKSGYTGPLTDMRVTFDGAIGAPANAIYTNWVIQEQMSCETWERVSSDEETDDTETI